MSHDNHILHGHSDQAGWGVCIHAEYRPPSTSHPSNWQTFAKAQETNPNVINLDPIYFHEKHILTFVWTKYSSKSEVKTFFKYPFLTSFLFSLDKTEPFFKNKKRLNIKNHFHFFIKKSLNMVHQSGEKNKSYLKRIITFPHQYYLWTSAKCSLPLHKAIYTGRPRS